jgi:secreted trypsin-like serine protease
MKPVAQKLCAMLAIVCASVLSGQEVGAQTTQSVSETSSESAMSDDMEADYVEPLAPFGYNCRLSLSGTRNCPYVQGGKYITRRDAPWQVQIYAQTQAREYSAEDRARFPLWELNHHCGGVLIAPNWVLTAAHCIDAPTPAGARRPDRTLKRVVANEFRVRLGSDNIASRPGSTFEMQRVIIHRRYDKASLANDIALIQIDRGRPSGIIQSWEAEPIALNFPPPMGGALGPFHPFRASGWGMTSAAERGSAQLKAVELARVPPPLCAQVRPNLRIDAPVLCALAPRGDTCRGDSGGPLVAGVANPRLRQWETVLVGIVSTGPPCGRGRGRPGIYTRISRYTDWIARAQTTKWPIGLNHKVVWLE